MNLKYILAPTLSAIMLLTSCIKDNCCDGTVSKLYAINGYAGINAASIMQAKVTKGTTFSVIAKGCSRDVEDLRIEVGTGQTIKIDFKRSLKRRDKVYIEITMPQLTRFQLAGAADGTISGFANDDVNTCAAHPAHRLMAQLLQLG